VETAQPQRGEGQVHEQHASRALPEERQDPGADQDRLVGRDAIRDFRGIPHRGELLERDLVGGKVGLATPGFDLGVQPGAQVVGDFGAPVARKAPDHLVDVSVDPLVPLDDHRDSSGLGGIPKLAMCRLPI